MSKGAITQIIGAVVDAQFGEKDLPAIYNALETEIGKNKLVLEVQQHLSEGQVRAVAMKNATDNALELVDDLTLTYNQTRQAAITTEILEIATAQVAME